MNIESPESFVEAFVESFLSHTGQAHKVTDLQRKLTTDCMRPCLAEMLEPVGYTYWNLFQDLPLQVKWVRPAPSADTQLFRIRGPQ